MTVLRSHVKCMIGLIATNSRRRTGSPQSAHTQKSYTPFDAVRCAYAHWLAVRGIAGRVSTLERPHPTSSSRAPPTSHVPAPPAPRRGPRSHPWSQGNLAVGASAETALCRLAIYMSTRCARIRIPGSSATLLLLRRPPRLPAAYVPY